MNFLGTTTKTIKTYGKRSNERVITIDTLNEINNKRLEGIPIKNTVKESSIENNAPQTNKDSITQGSTIVITKSTEIKCNNEKKKRSKTFTKGFTKPRYYLAPLSPLSQIQPSQERT